MRPVIVGERTNVIGSRKFKTLICDGKFDEASDIARAQIKNGAQIVDICLATQTVTRWRICEVSWNWP